MKPAPLKILLADDDEDDRNFFEKALEALSINYLLTTVTNGESLMNLLKNTTELLPDVLFLDINMPRKSGDECLEEIKQDERLKKLPVIMFSTLNDWGTINRLFKIGANVYIHKPSDFTQLKQVLHHALPISTDLNFRSTHVKYVINA
jgi:CheY-like chemotaxis protein